MAGELGELVLHFYHELLEANVNLGRTQTDLFVEGGSGEGGELYAGEEHAFERDEGGTVSVYAEERRLTDSHG
jgi:hypothetical protein